MLFNFGKRLDFCPTFELTEEKYKFASQCIEEYKKYFPEVLEEIKGIADGNKIPIETLHAILFCMYCFEFDNKCTCFLYQQKQQLINRKQTFFT